MWVLSAFYIDPQLFLYVFNVELTISQAAVDRLLNDSTQPTNYRQGRNQISIIIGKAPHRSDPLLKSH